MLAVCSGVSAAHAKGIIHRDLKPANIFLQKIVTGDTVPKVLDFGISKMREPGTVDVATKAFSLVGTPNYLSPEQADGNTPVDSRADVYALGAILYECLAGHPPHQGPTLFAILRSIVEADYPDISLRRPGLPPAFVSAVKTAMALRPIARFSTVHELGRALLPFASPKRKAFWTDYYGDRPIGLDSSVSEPLPISTSHRGLRHGDPPGTMRSLTAHHSLTNSLPSETKIRAVASSSPSRNNGKEVPASVVTVIEARRTPRTIWIGGVAAILTALGLVAFQTRSAERRKIVPASINAAPTPESDVALSRAQPTFQPASSSSLETASSRAASTKSVPVSGATSSAQPPEKSRRRRQIPSRNRNGVPVLPL